MAIVQKVPCACTALLADNIVADAIGFVQFTVFIFFQDLRITGMIVGIYQINDCHIVRLRIIVDSAPGMLADTDTIIVIGVLCELFYSIAVVFIFFGDTFQPILQIIFAMYTFDNRICTGNKGYFAY